MDYEITPVRVQRMRDAGEPFTLVDVREPEELRVASISGAMHIPIGDVPMRAHQELDPEDHIIVVWHHGVRSLNVTSWLRQQGFERAQSMQGGIDRWSREVDRNVPTY